MPEGAVDVGVLLRRPVRPVRRVHRNAVEVVHERDVGKLGDPDLHGLAEQLRQPGLVAHVGNEDVVDDLVVGLVLPPREVDEMAARHGHAHALVEPQRVIGIVDASAVPVERAGVLPLLEAVVEIRGQAEAGVDALALQELRQDGPDSGTAPPEADDVQLESIALRVTPETRAVLLPALPDEQLRALLRIELERVMPREQVPYRSDIWT